MNQEPQNEDEKAFIECPECSGSGQEIIGENKVSHDMAIDAGEPEMEGMFHSNVYGECRFCEGRGFIETPTPKTSPANYREMQNPQELLQYNWLNVIIANLTDKYKVDYQEQAEKQKSSISWLKGLAIKKSSIIPL